jgi:hypothetical protein
MVTDKRANGLWKCEYNGRVGDCPPNLLMTIDQTQNKGNAQPIRTASTNSKVSGPVIGGRNETGKQTVCLRNIYSGCFEFHMQRE